MAESTDKNTDNSNEVKKKGFYLKSPKDARRMIRRIANDLYMGELDPETARAIGYLVKVALDAMKQDTEAEENQPDMKVVRV